MILNDDIDDNIDDRVTSILVFLGGFIACNPSNIVVPVKKADCTGALPYLIHVCNI